MDRRLWSARALAESPGAGGPVAVASSRSHKHAALNGGNRRSTCHGREAEHPRTEEAAEAATRARRAREVVCWTSASSARSARAVDSDSAGAAGRQPIEVVIGHVHVPLSVELGGLRLLQVSHAPADGRGRSATARCRAGCPAPGRSARSRGQPTPAAAARRGRRPGCPAEPRRGAGPRSCRSRPSRVPRHCGAGAFRAADRSSLLSSRLAARKWSRSRLVAIPNSHGRASP